jgi:uncharacterized membrane protein
MNKSQLKRLSIVLGSLAVIGIMFYLSWILTPEGNFSGAWIFTAIISTLILLLISFIFFTLFSWVKTGKLPDMGNKSSEQSQVKDK